MKCFGRIRGASDVTCASSRLLWLPPGWQHAARRPLLAPGGEVHLAQRVHAAAAGAGGRFPGTRPLGSDNRHHTCISMQGCWMEGVRPGRLLGMRTLGRAFRAAAKHARLCAARRLARSAAPCARARLGVRARVRLLPSCTR